MLLEFALELPSAASVLAAAEIQKSRKSKVRLQEINFHTLKVETGYNCIHTSTIQGSLLNPDAAKAAGSSPCSPESAGTAATSPSFKAAFTFFAISSNC
jgi:hypothetical protein